MLCDVRIRTLEDVTEEQAKSLDENLKGFDWRKELFPVALRVQKGVYYSGFNFAYDMIPEVRNFDHEFFELSDPNHVIDVNENFDDKNYIGSYGVVDSVEQLLKLHDFENDPRNLVISLTEIKKSEQPSEGGWRWHKWGQYYGTHKIECEYLYDEKDIEQVYVYHVYIVDEQIKKEESSEHSTSNCS